MAAALEALRDSRGPLVTPVEMRPGAGGRGRQGTAVVTSQLMSLHLVVLLVSIRFLKNRNKKSVSLKGLGPTEQTRTDRLKPARSGSPSWSPSLVLRTEWCR